MTIARARLIDPTLTRWYHCMTRCVRLAHLLGDEKHNRKEWIESRLEELAGCFAVTVGGFAVMNNHLHVLLRLDPEIAAGWSDEEVVKRWGRLCPPRDKSRRPLPVTNDWIQWRLKGPIEDRRGLDSSREGMMAGFPLGSYVRLVDYTGRLVRPGKATISAELAGVFERLGSTAQSWHFRMKKLHENRLIGRFFAASQAKLQAIAEHFNLRYVVNLARCPAR
jgi:hypothetical protein